MNNLLNLQCIIGVDKRNPVFSIYRDKNNKYIYVYFGHALLEVIANKKDNPQLKLMLAQLYNANVKVKNLIGNFGYSYPTLKRWGDALKSGNLEKIYYALQGQGTPKKFTKEVEAFVRLIFNKIYPYNKYSYSSEIRKEIKEVFQVDISPETLRPVFKELKEKFNNSKKKIKK